METDSSFVRTYSIVVLDAVAQFEKSNLIERLCIPDRIFSFRVTWTDDQGNVHTNMGYRA